MTDDLQELLSAYLDGELTSDEQARVEQQLTEDADYRQLHDEMRALRSSLELLPRHRLHDDISRSVIRKAERTMLSDQRNTNGSHSGAAAAAAKTEEAPVKVERQQRFTTRSAVLYAAVALAACLVVMFFSSTPRTTDPVVEVPEKKPPEAGIGPKTVVANSQNNNPEAGNRVENGTTPENAPVENNPAAVPDPRMVASIPGHQRSANSTNKPPLVDNVPAVQNGNLVTVDPDAGKPAIDRALGFANEINKPLAGALVVVQCEATQEAIDSGAIDLILDRHAIKITAAGEKPAADAKSIDLPKVAIDLDLVYLEASALEVAAIFAEIQAQNHHFPTMKFGLAPDEEKRANQIGQSNTPGQAEEARGNAQIQNQPQKPGEPGEKQAVGEEKPSDDKPKAVVAKDPLEPWKPRAHRLKLGPAKEKEKVAVIARNTANPPEPAVRVLFVLRAAKPADEKK